MEAGRRLNAFVGHVLWQNGEPDQRVRQLGFTLLLATELLLRLLGGITVAAGDWTTVAIALAAALTVVVCLNPSRESEWAITTMALADLAVVGVGLFAAEDGGLGLVVLLPAIWLGGRYGLRGAALTVLGAVLLISLPGLIMHDTTGAAMTYLPIIPLLAGVSAVAIASGLDSARSAQSRAERKERELVRALETIEAQRHTSQAVFDAASVGLMLLDQDGQMVGMNRKYGEFVGLSLPEGTDIPWPGDCFAADGLTRLSPDEVPSARAARGEEFDDLRVWAGADPRTRRAVSVSARRALNAAGEFTGAALAGTDITDLMQAMQVKEDFVALVSHELRTPLTSIFGYVSMLTEDDAVAPHVARQLRVVARNAERLNRLVEELLLEAQSSDGSMSLSPERVDLSTIVAESVQAAGPAAAQARVEIEVDLPGPVVVTVDRQRIAQVVDNLVSNAIKYSLDGGVARVALTVRGTWVALSVADSGIGISEADREQLFTRFFRTRSAMDRAIQGVGLGLCITKAIVESHGGRIEVESEVGRGSEFRVTLPARELEIAS